MALSVNIDCFLHQEDMKRLRFNYNPENSSWTDVSMYFNNKKLKEEIKNRSLSEDSKWTDITAHDMKLALKKEVENRGLSEDSKWTDITAYDMKLALKKEDRNS
jgi:tmRNA-binding protein